MTPEEIVEEMKREFRGFSGSDQGRSRKARKYVGGLLPSFCDFLIELDTPGRGYRSLAAFFVDYPQITEGVSALTVTLPGGGQKTIRPAYERYHHLYVTEEHRLDNPALLRTPRASGATIGIGWTT